MLSKRRLLLVIDNFEHVLEAAVLVGELLAACFDLTVLATSRAALELTAEHRFVVKPLGIPEPPQTATVADVQHASATAMFMTAAARYDPHFAVDAETAPAVAMLCARLDGLPLALELAAARIPLFGIEELAARLNRELGALGVGPRDAPARQRTLNATIDWSYGLLDEAQKLAFSRFGVFAGGATIHTVEDVVGADIETIEALVSKNMLVRRRAEAGSSRLAMLDTVREFALARLAEDPGHESIRRRHLMHYLTLVERVTPQLWRPQENEALAVLDREIDNLRAALLWGLERAPDLAVRLAGPLGDYSVDPPGSRRLGLGRCRS